MRGYRRKPDGLGCVAIGLGIVILLALILPSGFWWFALGVALIVFGVIACIRCR